MSSFDELIKKLNDLNLIQKDEWREDIPIKIWDEYFEGFEEVATGLNVDKHRWYETSISVVKIGSRFLGICSVTDTKGDTYIEDLYHNYGFYEMKEVKMVSYERK